jgi:hypothetical protein
MSLIGIRSTETASIREFLKQALVETGCMTETPIRKLTCTRTEEGWRKKASVFAYEKDASGTATGDAQESAGALLSAIIDEMDAKRLEGFSGAVVTYLPQENRVVFYWL